MGDQKELKFRNGYAILAVPDSGLFVKNGTLVTGHRTDMKHSKLIVFSRQDDAQRFADENARTWENGDAHGHRWEFKVIPVMVHEKP